jgi:hypothetical protein
MRSKTKYLIAIILAALMLPFVGIGTAQGQGAGPIHAEVDRTSLSTGETLLLTVTVSSNSMLTAPRPNMPALQGFNIASTSSSSQISIINGAMSSQEVYRYLLQPYEAGDLVIEPISISLGGQTYSTQPITIRVSQGAGAPAPAPAPSNGQPVASSAELAGQDLYAEAVVENPTPYVGQQVAYVFRFYQAVNLWAQPNYEPPAFTGFWSESQSTEQQYQAQAAGRIYRVTEIRTVLFPSVVGPVTIEPARLTIPRSLFQSGRTFQTQPVEMDVRPLPAGAPAGFNGAVGQFALSATVDTTQTRVNEPLTWQVTLNGRGNLNAAPDPVWPEIDGWRSFESQATVNTEVREGQVIGSRGYERLLVPSAEGQFTIPSLEYVYFDPDAGQYQVLRTEPIPVSIAPGDPSAATVYQSAAGDLAAAADKETVDQLASDIRHLKPVPDGLALAGSPITSSALYWAAWVFPIVGALGYFAWQRRQRYWENNLGLARSSQARKKARKALAQARKRTDDAYSAASQILTTYLADKLDRPVAGLTHQALADLLAGNGVTSDLIERVEVILVTGELGRFAPGADDPDHARSLLQEVDVLIAALEKEL